MHQFLSKHVDDLHYAILTKLLDKPIAYPASKAAFHCLYLSPNLTTTTSACSIAFLVLIEFILADL